MTDDKKTPAGPLRPTAEPEMLTAEEIESLRQEAKESSAYFRMRFAHLRPKTED